MLYEVITDSHARDDAEVVAQAGIRVDEQPDQGIGQEQVLVGLGGVEGADEDGADQTLV